MAGNGVPPDPHGRRARSKAGGDHVVANGKTRGPALPRFVPGRDKVLWHPVTRRWWDGWRKSPQAIRMMTGPDWDFLLETAVLHHAFWSDRRLDLASELRLRLRLREAKFGATPEDRARLGVEMHMPGSGPLITVDEGGTASVTDIEQRRKRLTES